MKLSLKLVRALLSALLLLFWGAAGVQAQTITNPSFETPTTSTYLTVTTATLTGWTVTVTTGGVNVNASNSAAGPGTAPSGAQVLELQLTGTSIAQTVTGLIVGHTYNLTVASAFRSGYIDARINVSAAGTTVGIITPAQQVTNSTGAYTDQTVSFTATATSESLTLANIAAASGQSGGIFFLDNLRLVDAGAPAALAGGTLSAATTTATSITPQEAAIAGGTAPYSTVFSYSAATNGTYTQIGTAVAGASPVASAAATGLTVSTTYYFRAVTTDSAGTPATVTAPSTTTGTPLATSAAPPRIFPDDAGILYSPYTWLVTHTAAKAINSGSYFRTLLKATATCLVNLTIGTGTPYTQVYARIDGGAWQKYVPTTPGAQTWTLTFPSPTTATNHLLEFIIKSTTGTQDRWSTQTVAVQFTGLTLDAGATVSLPAARKYRILIYGDSITEGSRVFGYSGIPNDTDQEDATADYAYKLEDLLDAEVGQVGFGSSGFVTSGAGSVPTLLFSYNFLWNGQARPFTPVPDLVIFNEGANEAGATIGPTFTAIVNGIGTIGTTTFSGLAGTRFLVLRPFGGQNAVNLQAAVVSYANVNVTYGDTTGLFNTADSSDTLHPYAYSHLGYLAPGVAALALPLLRAPTNLSLTITGTGSTRNLSWTADTLATSYKVYRGTTPDTLAVIATVAAGTTTYTDTARPAGNIYYSIISLH